MLVHVHMTLEDNLEAKYGLIIEWLEVAEHVNLTFEDNLNRVMESDECMNE